MPEITLELTVNQLELIVDWYQLAGDTHEMQEADNNLYSYLTAELGNATTPTYEIVRSADEGYWDIVNHADHGDVVAQRMMLDVAEMLAEKLNSESVETDKETYRPVGITRPGGKTWDVCSTVTGKDLVLGLNAGDASALCGQINNPDVPQADVIAVAERFIRQIGYGQVAE